MPRPRPGSAKSGPPRHRRFLSDSPGRREAWLQAALTARRPSPYPLTTVDRDARTLAEIAVLDSRLGADGLRLRVRLENRGETAWLHRAPKPGRVTIALRSGELGSPTLREAERHDLPRTVPAGESIELDLHFRIPEDARDAPWQLDLVNEEVFWFSERGTRPVPVSLSRG